MPLTTRRSRSKARSGVIANDGIVYPDTMLFVDDELLPARVGARAIGRRAGSARLTALAAVRPRPASGARRARGARADTSHLSAGGHAPRTPAVVRARAEGQHGRTSGAQRDQQKTSCSKHFQGLLFGRAFSFDVTVRRAAATPVLYRDRILGVKDRREQA